MVLTLPELKPRPPCQRSPCERGDAMEFAQWLLIIGIGLAVLILFYNNDSPRS